jgi:hypothetical protein
MKHSAGTGWGSEGKRRSAAGECNRIAKQQGGTTSHNRQKKAKAKQSGANFSGGTKPDIHPDDPYENSYTPG